METVPEDSDDIVEEIIPALRGMDIRMSGPRNQPMRPLPLLSPQGAASSQDLASSQAGGNIGWGRSPSSGFGIGRPRPYAADRRGASAPPSQRAME